MPLPGAERATVRYCHQPLEDREILAQIRPGDEMRALQNVDLRLQDGTMSVVGRGCQYGGHPNENQGICTAKEAWGGRPERQKVLPRHHKAAQPSFTNQVPPWNTEEGKEPMNDMHVPKRA